MQRAFFSFAHCLEKLAKKIDLPEFYLFAAMSKEHYVNSVNPNPLVLMEIQKETLNIYNNYQKKHVTPQPLLIYNLDVGVMAMFRSTLTLIQAGYVDEGFKVLDQSYKWADSLNHSITKTFAPMCTLPMKYLLGEKLSFSEASVFTAVNTELKIPYCAFVAQFFFGMALAESSTAKEDQLHGLAIMEKSLGDEAKQFGQTLFVFFGILLLKIYLQFGLIDKGLSLANRMQEIVKETGIEAAYGTQEFQREKVELLLAKYQETQDEETLKTAAELIDWVIGMNVQRTNKILELKSILVGIKVCKVSNNTEKLTQYQQQLESILQFFGQTARKHQTVDIKEAEVLLKQLKIE